MNGKPGDHPLTDILNHGLEVYGQEADERIRRISRLCSRRELREWWSHKIAWSQDRELVLREATTYYASLLRRAGSHGWEVDDEEEDD